MDFAIIALYVAVLLAIGVWIARKVKNVQLGPGALGVFVFFSGMPATYFARSRQRRKRTGHGIVHDDQL